MTAYAVVRHRPPPPAPSPSTIRRRRVRLSTSSSSASASAASAVAVAVAGSVSVGTTLYHHLCNDHVGRKATNNLSLSSHRYCSPYMTNTITTHHLSFRWVRTPCDLQVLIFIAQQFPTMPSPDRRRVSPKRDQQAPSPQQSLSAADGEAGKGERVSHISTYLRMSSHTRSVCPQAHQFPLSQPSVVPIDEHVGLSPQTLRPEKSNLRSPAIISDLNNSNKPEPEPLVLSPRPICHKNSFTIEHGAVKSEQVVDLEHTAAIDNELDKTEIDTKQQMQLPSHLSSQEHPGLPPQPVLAPVAVNRRRDYHLQEGGLDALERRLLAQVGTRKPESDKKPDIRTVLSAPLAFRSASRQCDPANDSAKSSLTLAAESPQAVPQSPEHNKRLPTPPIERNSLVSSKGEKSSERSSDRAKRNVANGLKKAATSRVPAWLGGIGDAAAPPVVDTPNTINPKSPVEEISPLNEADPSPLLCSPPLPLITDQTNPAIEPSPNMKVYQHALLDSSYILLDIRLRRLGGTDQLRIVRNLRVPKHRPKLTFRRQLPRRISYRILVKQNLS